MNNRLTFDVTQNDIFVDGSSLSGFAVIVDQKFETETTDDLGSKCSIYSLDVIQSDTDAKINLIIYEDGSI